MLLLASFPAFFGIPCEFDGHAAKLRTLIEYGQSEGLTVIPAVGWSTEDSFEFCFDGIEKGSVVAVSTLGVRRVKDAFMLGFRELCQRLEPEAVICYCEPFAEMRQLARVIAMPYEAEAAKCGSFQGRDR